MPYIEVREAEHTEPQTFEIFGSLCIMVYGFRIIVLRSIQFYDQLRFGTIKVRNIVTDDFLPPKTNRIAT